MELHTLDNILIIKDMEEVDKLGKMEVVMRVLGETEKPMVKADLSMQKEMYMKVIG